MLDVVRSAFAPTVLLVDDDPNITRRWTKEFHKGTSLGVLTANSIPEGIRLATDPRLRVDAIVTDILFESEKQDELNNLSNGIEFLQHLGGQNIDVPMFVVSASAEMVDYKNSAKKQNVPIAEYYDKLTFASGDRPGWIDIQRQVLAKTFGEDSDIAKALGTLSANRVEAIDIMNETLCRLQLPIRTYIQDLGPGADASIVRPIEAICVARGAARVDAYATTLGLPAHGTGEDITSAVDDLRNIILLEVETLLKEDQSNLSEYAKRVVERISEYVRVKRS